MSAILALLLFQAEQGQATYYRQDLMEQVAHNRGMDLAGYSGVALNDCDRLGEWVWLEWGPGEFTGPHRSVDCAEGADLVERVRLGRIVEVDAQTAQAVGFYGVGPRWVGIWMTLPPMRWRAN